MASKCLTSQVWWYTPVIVPATLEAEQGDHKFEGSPGKVKETLSQKQNTIQKN
jgi:hypothetical protein